MDNDKYFSVDAVFPINAELLTKEESIPSMNDFIKEIPSVFHIANQCVNIDRKHQKLLTEVCDTNSNFEALLQAQNHKINLLLHFMLKQVDNKKHRYYTTAFGASGVCFVSDKFIEINTKIRLKLFLSHPLTAIYCYAETLECNTRGTDFIVKANFLRLQENDEDVLIRSALYYQQKLLRERALARQD